MSTAQVQQYVAKCKPMDYIYADTSDGCVLLGQLTRV